MKPTDEQSQIVKLFKDGKSLNVKAFAGAGKTTTLLQIAEASAELEKSGIYFSFNKKMVEDIKKKKPPNNLQCYTTHAFALQKMKMKFDDMDKLIKTNNTKYIESALDVETEYFGEPPKSEKEPDDRYRITPYSFAVYVKNTIKNFCHSESEYIDITHTSFLNKRLVGLLRYRGGDIITDDIDYVREKVKNMAISIWQRMISPNDSMRLGHDGYLKVWSLSKPKLDFDFILFDEAQDTNPCVLSVINNQTAQRIFVGDTNQQIYEWRGAINAMENVDNIDATKYITQSFRFGPRIAELATGLLRAMKEEKTVNGNDECDSTVRFTPHKFWGDIFPPPRFFPGIYGLPPELSEISPTTLIKEIPLELWEKVRETRLHKHPPESRKEMLKTFENSDEYAASHITPDAILTLKNMDVLSAMIELLNEGMSVSITNDKDDLKRLIDGVEKLKNNQECDVEEFWGFTDWDSVLRANGTDNNIVPKFFIEMIEKYEIEEIRDFLAQTQNNEKKADIILSTVHKAKGREWDCVELLGDFSSRLFIKDARGIRTNIAGCKLIYVAVTRARKDLIMPADLYHSILSFYPKQDQEIIEKLQREARKNAPKISPKTKENNFIAPPGATVPYTLDRVEDGIYQDSAGKKNPCVYIHFQESGVMPRKMYKTFDKSGEKTQLAKSLIGKKIVTVPWKDFPKEDWWNEIYEYTTEANNTSSKQISFL